MSPRAQLVIIIFKRTSKVHLSLVRQRPRERLLVPASVTTHSGI